MTENKKIFFASDFHLGLKTGHPPAEREKKVVSWLRYVAPQAKEIYLLGDVFDFWWEYKLVVPKGFTRFLGALSEMTDSGISVHFLTGNHDMWAGNYLTEECGLTIHTSPVTVSFNEKTFHLAHGEGLGTKNMGYKLLLGVFHNSCLRKLYSTLHPTIGVGIGHRWSLSSRLGKGISKEFLGEEKEDLIRYVNNFSGSLVDYFIFGHRHLRMEYKTKKGRNIIFLGDWIKEGSYAEWDGESLLLKTYC